jgi:hypothetical protein
MKNDTSTADPRIEKCRERVAKIVQASGAFLSVFL